MSGEDVANSGVAIEGKIGGVASCVIPRRARNLIWSSVAFALAGIVIVTTNTETWMLSTAALVFGIVAAMSIHVLLKAFVASQSVRACVFGLSVGVLNWVWTMNVAASSTLWMGLAAGTGMGELWTLWKQHRGESSSSAD